MASRLTPPLLLALLATPAAAQTDAITPLTTPQPPAADHSPPTPAALAAQGAALLAAGQPENALPLLEAALLADPDLIGARIDLALAYAALDQPELARALIAPIARRPDLPAPLKKLWQPPSTTTLTQGLAYTTNRTYAPATTHHLLTTPWPLPHTTAPAQGGIIYRSQLTHQSPLLTATLTHDHDPTGLAPFTALQLATPTVALTHIRWQEAPLLTELAAQLTANSTLAYRHWHNAEPLSTLRLAYTIGATHPLTLTLDLPTRAKRPGGTTYGLTLTPTLTLEQPTWRLTAAATVHLARDSRGYSPLIAHNAPRHLATGQLTLTLEPTGPTPYRPFIQWTYLEQKSNLTLFTLNRSELLIGLRLTW
jgi:hypothetical protein